MSAPLHPPLPDHALLQEQLQAATSAAREAERHLLALRQSGLSSGIVAAQRESYELALERVVGITAAIIERARAGGEACPFCAPPAGKR